MKKRWKPKVGEKYWFVNFGYWSVGNVNYEYYSPDFYEKRLYNAGNMFKTKKEAEAKLKLIKKVLKK